MKAKLTYLDEFGVKNYTPLYRLSVSLGCLIFMMSLFSFIIMVAESGSSGNPKLNSFLDSLWYGHAVITTIGFGDVVPATTIGKAFTMLFSIFGITMLVSMGRSLDELMFGHTETETRNRELRELLKRDIDLNEKNEILNKKILESNLLANTQNTAILSHLNGDARPRY